MFQLARRIAGPAPQHAVLRLRAVLRVDVCKGGSVGGEGGVGWGGVQMGGG